ncbi:MAG: hypothetical protein FWG12_00875 [Holophagaceae bacterium]|jgi:hypothetical protein|nr:hypothetical protein [Holophagaceae bacterium]
MKQLKQSLLAFSLIAGASFACIGQQTPIQERTVKIGRIIGEADKLREEINPREALAIIEEELETELPPFDGANFETVSASWTLYSSMARLNFEAARASLDGGFWEKAAEFHKKEREVVNGALAKYKDAMAKIIQNWDNERKVRQSIIDANGEAIVALKAKDEKDYTNEDYLSKEKLMEWEKAVKEAEDAIKYFEDRIARAEKEAEFYNPPEPREDAVLQHIADQQAGIDTYRGGPGDKAKWVEGVVANHVQYMQNFGEAKDKIHFTYRLLALSPDSKTVPVLLNLLQGKATDAELRRAIQANRAPARR